MIKRRFRDLGPSALLLLGLFPLLILLTGQDSCAEDDGDGDGFTPADGDCDDRNAETYPGAPEICDGEDNDCDRQVDEGLETTYYQDRDADGYGVEDQTKVDCSVPPGYAELSGDCDDSNPAVNPGAQDICDELDNDCDTEIDEAPEFSYYPDEDGDGYGAEELGTPSCVPIEGLIDVGGDCDDADASIHPGVLDICDGFDNDCDGDLDEDPNQLYSLDVDGDGFGTLETAIPACSPPPNSDGWDEGSGGVDTEPNLAADTPVGPTIEPTIDPTVEPTVEPTVDPTLEPTLEPTVTPTMEPTIEPTLEPTPTPTPEPQGVYVSAFGDCDDDDAAAYPGAEEVCDGIDNDCDSFVDEGRSYYLDRDQDGFGDLAEVYETCAMPPGYSEAGYDCDDSDATVFPGAPDEAGDDVDQDCGGADGAQPKVGLGDGSLESIQAAVDAANAGETVWVGAGIYLESEVNMGGKALALTATHGPEATCIDADGDGAVFVFANGETADTVVRGFTLTDGFASEGGALSISGASPTLIDLDVWGNRALLLGGAASVSDDGNPSFVDSRLYENIARDNSAESSHGGGLAVVSSSLSLAGTTVSGNLALSSAADGGGLYATGSDITLADSWLYRNSSKGASAHGAGAYLTTSNLEAVGGGFSGNSALGSGGGIHAEDSAITLEGCEVADNTSTNAGGGIRLMITNAVITNTTISGNIEHNEGGGGIAAANSELTLDNSLILDNATYGQAGGGALLLSSATANLTHTLVLGNAADFNGGGVAVLNGAEATLNNSRLTSNVSAASGGAIYVGVATATLWHSVLTDNHAEDGGGVFLAKSSTGTLTNSILAYNVSHNLFLEPGPAGPDPVATVTYNDLYNPFGYLNHNLQELDPSNLTYDPRFMADDDDGLPVDFHLSLESSLIDAGDSAEGANLDADGSQPDMGIYGGSLGDSWDLDQDGLPDYFWPGEYVAPPAGFISADYDCNDLDASNQSCP